MKFRSSQDYLDSRPLSESLPWDSFAERAAGSHSENTLTKLRDFHRDGFVVLEQVIPCDLIDEFNEVVSTILSNHTSFPEVLIDGTAQHRGRRLADLNEQQLADSGLKLATLDQQFGTALQLALNTSVTEVLAAHFSGTPALLQSLTFDRGSQQSVHQDFSYVNTQGQLARLAASWIPLEDIHQDSGPLEYYAGSHRVDKYGFFDWGGGSVIVSRDGTGQRSTGEQYQEYLQESIQANGFERHVFLPRKGDVLIWHGALIHGGTTVTDATQTRKSFVCHYTSLESHPQVWRNELNGGVSFSIAAHKPLETRVTSLQKTGAESRLKTRLRRMIRQFQKR
ncbi:MAG: phytanoyl-CoA dioxygenase family protein [Fuerstiella sp.]|nr:phytanoyl-CoA dioxygenase family protein [Fuerstiella sp.]